MEQFIDYVSRFVPDFRSRIRGASAAEIETLEQAVGRPLPGFYKQFLSRMGHDAGGISLGYDTSTRIADLIEFHSGNLRPTPSDCVAIAVFGVDFDVCLHLPATGTAGDKSAAGERVLATDGVLVYVIVGETLEKVLFQRAFRNHEIRSFAHVAAWSIDNLAARAYATANGRSMRDTARQLSAEAGFAPEWFSDPYSLCARKGGTALYVLQQEQQGRNIVDMGTVVAVGAPTREEAERAGAPFAERLGLRAYTYRGLA